ncbi:MAG: hypothetical protein NTZ27_12235 [Ignavibacteriales bacterium]|nr:hypothetical protein [Ignavibacteriales bacterium]
MKKLSAISLVLIFAVSLFICSCSASGQVSTNKQQNAKTVSVSK